MKKLLIIFFILISQLVFAQGKEDQFFIFDKNWHTVSNIKKADYFLRVRFTVDSNYEWTYYKIFGPRIKRESFKDEKATIKNGQFIYYDQDGFMASAGEYLNGQLNGSWYFKNKKGQVTGQKDYDKGVLLFDTTFAVKEKDDYKLELGQVESEYPGSAGSWQQFLAKNLHYPERAFDAFIMGEVRLQFIVGKDGTVSEPEIEKSVEYSLDEEALRIMSISEKWIPASDNGKKMRSYKIQPIKFRLERG